MSENEIPSEHRVKVYTLDDQAQWTDSGTGNIHFEPTANDSLMFVIRSEEEEDNVLLAHVVDPGIDYSLQSPTIILWNGADGKEHALSFQDANGCANVWEGINMAQTKQYSSEGRSAGDNGSQSRDADPLPMPEPSNLDEILSRLVEVSMVEKSEVANSVMEDGWINRLLEIFHQAEDLENMEQLHKLFHIFKAMIVLNDANILNAILTPDWFIEFVGPLEYDPDVLPGAPRNSYREYVKSANLKNVVNITDEHAIECIHRIFFINFLKDVVMLKHLDDGTLSSLNQMIIISNIVIVSAFVESTELCERLFSLLTEYGPYRDEEVKANEEYTKKRKEVFAFLSELVGLAKPPITVTVREGFYNRMKDHNVLDVLDVALSSAPAKKQEWLWVSVADLLYTVSIMDTSYVRDCTIRSGKEDYLSLFSTTVCDDVDTAVTTQLTEIIKTLLETDVGMEIHKDTSNGDFVDHFFKRYFSVIVRAITRPGQLDIRSRKHNSQYQATEIINFLLMKHKQRMNVWIVEKNLLGLAVNMIPHGSSDLKLSVIRLVRRSLMTHPFFVAEEIVSKDLFRPIVDAFLANGSRYNLLNSTIIDLFEYIRSSNPVNIIDYVMKNFWSQLEGVRYVYTFSLLKRLHDKNQSEGSSSSRLRRVAGSGDLYYIPYGEDEEEEGQVDISQLAEIDDSSFLERDTTSADAEEEDGDLLSLIKKRSKRLKKKKKKKLGIKVLLGQDSSSPSKLSSGVSSPSGSPNTSPNSSPKSKDGDSKKSDSLPTKRALVGYNDGDSDDEDEDDSKESGASGRKPTNLSDQFTSHADSSEHKWSSNGRSGGDDAYSEASAFVGLMKSSTAETPPGTDEIEEESDDDDDEMSGKHRRPSSQEELVTVEDEGSPRKKHKRITSNDGTTGSTVTMT